MVLGRETDEHETSTALQAVVRLFEGGRRCRGHDGRIGAAVCGDGRSGVVLARVDEDVCADLPRDVELAFRDVDGSDPGADQNVVEWSTEGAASGAPNPYLDFRIKSVSPTAGGAAIRFTAYSDASCGIQGSSTRAYADNLGTVSQTRTGRYGVATVAGLGPQVTRWAKITCEGRYRETELITTP